MGVSVPPMQGRRADPGFAMTLFPVLSSRFSVPGWVCGRSPHERDARAYIPTDLAEKSDDLGNHDPALPGYIAL